MFDFIALPNVILLWKAHNQAAADAAPYGCNQPKFYQVPAEAGI
jgi:hypothetical protein